MAGFFLLGLDGMSIGPYRVPQWCPAAIDSPVIPHCLFLFRHVAVLHNTLTLIFMISFLSKTHAQNVSGATVAPADGTRWCASSTFFSSAAQVED